DIPRRVASHASHGISLAGWHPTLRMGYPSPGSLQLKKKRASPVSFSGFSVIAFQSLLLSHFFCTGTIKYHLSFH
ncbi:MAG: hypothetical protein LUG93_12480, partial [Lachnospiraceae bacterium]|nr:hypothetical protein [Lachnospiraceae bacterium]